MPHAPARVVADLAVPANNTGHAAGDSYNRIENLVGSRFADTLSGNVGNNVLTGGKGRDTLTGRSGRDTFKYEKTTDSPPGVGLRDRISDFKIGPGGSGDRIDLSAIDAKTGPGNQAFTYIGTAPFHNAKGELRVQQVGSTAVASSDVNGDGVADFEIGILSFNVNFLRGKDFLK